MTQLFLIEQPAIASLPYWVGMTRSLKRAIGCATIMAIALLPPIQARDTE